MTAKTELKHWTMAALLLNAGAASAAEPPLFDGVQPTSLKGVEIDRVAEPILLEMALGLNFNPLVSLNLCKPTPGTSYACTGWTEIAGVLTQTKVGFGPDQKVQVISATFQSAQFDRLEAAARAKWGKPDTTGTEGRQNAYGAQVTVIEYHWPAVNGGLASLLNHMDMQRGMLVLESGSHRAAAKAATDEAARRSPL
jgi:hypothetical protein